METAKDMLKGKTKRIISVPMGTTIFAAMQRMNQAKVGAILVTQNDKTVGIWTERDLLQNMMDEKFDPSTAKIENYMTTNLVSAPHTDTVYNLMDKFLGLRIRHILIEENGEFIGLVSGGDVMRCAIHEKERELQQLNSMVSWEYYEDWKWKP